MQIKIIDVIFPDLPLEYLMIHTCHFGYVIILLTAFGVPLPLGFYDY